MSTYYGRYKSSATMLSGCIKELVSKPRESVNFPAQISYFCSACNASHGFRFAGAQLVNTPTQVKRFKEFCTSHFIEADVEVP